MLAEALKKAQVKGVLCSAKSVVSETKLEMPDNYLRKSNLL